MSRKIPDNLRRKVAARASYCCEYCLLPEKAAFFAFQVDHIISIRHKGKTDSNNLAYACSICNRNKGSDLGTLVGDPPVLVRLFNPRLDSWQDHFKAEQSGEIRPKTDIGSATVVLLDLNHPDTVIERKKLILSGVISI